MKESAHKEIKPKVYSYIRWSTPSQDLGTSDERQVNKAKAFADKEGLEFDESLRDEGVSSYRGTHRMRGALGRFLERVERGEIAKGSILVVEKISRLGRERVLDTLQNTILTLTKHGITLHTISPPETYTWATLQDSNRLKKLIDLIEFANHESKEKSYFLTEAHKIKRRAASEHKEIATNMLPAWLEAQHSADGRRLKPLVRPGAEIALRTIFELRKQGFGKSYIARKMNGGDYWRPPLKKKKDEGNENRWGQSYIQRLVENRALIGEYQPHKSVEKTIKVNGKEFQKLAREPVGEPIEDYFPAVLPRGLFDEVQVLLAARRGKGDSPDARGRRGGKLSQAYNIFRYLAKCAYCGASMVYSDKGPKSKRYYVCDRRRLNNGCNAPPFRYEEAVSTVLENCRRLRPEVVLVLRSEHQAKEDALRAKIASAQVKASELKVKIDNLLESIESGSAALGSRLKEREKELGATQAQLREFEGELRAIESAPRNVEQWQSSLGDMISSIDREGERGIEHRVRLHAHLSAFIFRIDFFSKGYASARPYEGRSSRRQRVTGTASGEGPVLPMHDDLEEELNALADEVGSGLAKNEHWNRFVKELMTRRQSKDGRFVRVLYKSGAFADFVPAGSIASGISHERGSDETRNVGPRIALLWQRYQQENGLLKMRRKRDFNKR